MESLRPRALDGGFLAAGAVALAYLAFKLVQTAPQPGYDLRFFWTAGALWLQGENPYAPGYQAFGERMIEAGNVPELWVYPPNVFPLAAILGAGDLATASWLFAALNVVLLIAGCWLCVRAASAALGNDGALAAWFSADSQTAPWRQFCALTFLMATLEGAAITITVGQCSILMFFGAAFMAFGVTRARRWPAALGLAILCMKPQFGAALALAALFFVRDGWRIVAGAALISCLFALPALIISPASPFEWLRNVAIYDEQFPRASDALAMTGVRTLAQEAFGVDIGSTTALAIALAILAATLALVRAPLRAQGGEVLAIALAGAAMVAFAPLHLYDLVVIAIAAAVLLRQARGAPLMLAALGAAMIWRAEDIADFTGFHAPGADVFAGSRLATLGAIVVFAAFVMMLRARGAQPVLDKPGKAST
ncbi:MAG: DUF2029 domain-containing protein [Alphaproteobacteria bacterium]|nr:DUF2029 domain-containing protein [Alphaproteobacteria bacterium]